MIKAIIFDMDGVLIDAKEWHYEALNRALGLFGYTISRADHLTTFDGLPTRRKLEILSATEGLSPSLHGFVNEMKQIYTRELINVRCKPQFVHEYALARLKALGYRMAVASNSTRWSVEMMIERANLTRFFEFLLSNEDVSKAKPDPEIYQTAMARMGVMPSETLVIEDNENGFRSALASGACLLKVRDINDVNFDNIRRRISELDNREAS